MADSFRIGVSPDFQTHAAGLLEPVLEEMLAPLPHVTWDFFPMRGKEIYPDEIVAYDGLLTLLARVTPESLAGNEHLAVIARWGVGYDMIDVPACTEADVLLAITTDAVRKPVAEAIVTFFLALAKKLSAKDQLVRTGRWDLKAETSGLGLSGKIVGSVGSGNIGGEMFRLLGPFDLGRRLVYDPYLSQERAATLDVELVDLETIFRESDFVAVNCPHTAETEGMIGAELFALMKPSAYFVNTARGPIVRQADLTAALQAGQLAGAGLDVFEEEPLPVDHPLIGMDNVILSPHALAWTDDLYRDNGVGAIENILNVFQGQLPKYIVNRAVTEQAGFQAKLGRMKSRWSAA
ncbi:MAG: NAD(P)-dependent oxidoreductase [Caldilineaceae bacterium]